MHGAGAAWSANVITWYHRRRSTHMVDTLKSYGVKEQAAAIDGLAAHAGRIGLAGYSVFHAAFDDHAPSDFGARVADVVRRQAEEFGSDRLQQIGDGFTARCPLVDEAAFLKLRSEERRVGKECR